MTQIHPVVSVRKRSAYYSSLLILIRGLETQTFLINVFIFLLQLVISVLVAWWLGPVGRGELAAALLWPTVLIYIGSFGLIDSVAYYAARTAQTRTHLYLTAAILALLQSLLIIPVAIVALPTLLASQRPAVVTASQVYLSVIPLSLIAQYGLSIIQGHMKIAAFNLLRSIRPIGYLIGVLFFKSTDIISIINIVYLQIVLNVIILIGAVIVLRHQKISFGTRFDRDVAKSLLKYGSKVYVGRLSGLMNERLDQLLLAAFVPPLQLGLYVTAVSSAIIIQPVAQAFSTVLMPRVAQVDDCRQQATWIQRSFQNYFIASFALIPLMVIALPVAIPLIYGSSFHGAIIPAEILLIGSFMFGARIILAGGAMAMGNAWLGSIAEVVAVAVTAVLLLFLLPSHGIVGAALATFIAYGTSLFVTIYGLHTKHDIKWNHLLRINWAGVKEYISQRTP